MIIRTGIGQDSHRYGSLEACKECVIGGLVFKGVPGFIANSDGDVVLHAVCNAISSVSGVKILGGIADDLLEKNGIVDSAVYVKHALASLGRQKVSHLAISIEGKYPYFSERINEMRRSIADLMGVDFSQIGITATSGEGLTEVGCGEGVQALAILTTCEE